MIPRYARPTKSTSLYSYTNRDQDLIKQGFRAGNYTFLAKFPQRITPFGITAALKASAKKIVSTPSRAMSVKKASPGYEWIPDSYNLKQDYLRNLRKDSVKKRNTISRRDFISSGTPDRLRQRETSQRSYVSINTSFDSVANQASRLKWIKDVQIKHGSFKNGKTLDLNREKSNATEIISIIRKKIAVDWESTDFDIGINQNQCIEIRFYLESLESTESMHYYLSMLINKNQEIGKLGLRKIQNKWGVKQGKFLVFVVAPAWVKIKPELKLRSFSMAKTVNPPVARRKSLWSNQPTHISTRESSRSIHPKLF